MSLDESRAHRGSEPTPRRSFLWDIGALAVSAVTSLAGVAAGVWVFLDPLLRKPKPPDRYRRAGGDAGEGFFRVASLTSVPEDGVPRRFAIVADRIDAWNYIPNQPIGAVFLRRESGKELQVFHSTCPHAGCSVSSIQSASAFHCPCHNSSFDWDGKRVARPGKVNPAPRDLDQLKYKVVDGEVWVEFKEFYTGRPEATPKT